MEPDSIAYSGARPNIWAAAARLSAAALLFIFTAAAADTVEIKGRVTNQLAGEKYRTVEVIVTDRVGVVLGRAHPDKRGSYELKISCPRYIIIKAVMKGYPPVLYQLDTQEVKESTTDREENKAFGELRVPTYYQNITFGTAAGPPGEYPALAKPMPNRSYRRRGSHVYTIQYATAARLLTTHMDRYSPHASLLGRAPSGPVQVFASDRLCDSARAAT